MKPQLTFITDAHSISLFRDCEEKYNKRIKQLLVSKKKNGALESGIVFHAGVAAYRLARKLGRSDSEAFNIGLHKLRTTYEKEMPIEFRTDPCPDERRSLPNLEREFEGFVPYEERQKFEYLYIEQSMGISLGTIETEKAIYNVIYAGIVDAILRQQGYVFVDDLKTTTMNISQAWIDSFRLSQAMMGYVVGMQELLEEPIYGAIMSIVWIQQKSKGPRAKPLNEYFHTSVMTFNQSQLAEWYTNTLKTITRMIHADEEKSWELSFGNSCAFFNGCTFKEICWTSPGVREKVVEQDFERKTWTPLEEIRSREVSEEEWKQSLISGSLGGEE